MHILRCLFEEDFKNFFNPGTEADVRNFANHCQRLSQKLENFATKDPYKQFSVYKEMVLKDPKFSPKQLLQTIEGFTKDISFLSRVVDAVHLFLTGSSCELFIFGSYSNEVSC